MSDPAALFFLFFVILAALATAWFVIRLLVLFCADLLRERVR